MEPNLTFKFNADGELFLSAARKVDSAITGLGQSADVTAAKAKAMGDTAAASFQKTEVSAKQTAAAMRNLPAQFTDIFVSLQGGQAPLTVLFQQGGQVADMFGGVGNAARAMGGYVASLVNPFSVAAAAIGAVGIAYYQGSKEADAFRLALVNTGNAAGITASEMAGLASAMGSSFGQTIGQSAEALAAMAATGQVGRASLQQFAQTAVDMEKTTGQSIEATAKIFADLGREPVTASAKLNESLNYLSASTYAQIKAAQDLGETEKAAALAQEAYSKAMDGRTQNLTQNLGYIESAWKGVKNVAKETWDAMLGVGRDKTADSQLYLARRQLEDTLARQKQFGEGSFLSRLMDDDVAKKRQEIEHLTEIERMQKRAGVAAIERAAAEKKGIAAIDATSKAIENGVSKREQETKALKEFRENLALAEKEGRKFTAQQIASAEAAIREKYADKKTSSGMSAGESALAEANARIKANQAYLVSLQTVGAAAEKQTATELALGKVTEELTTKIGGVERANKLRLKSALEKQIEQEKEIALEESNIKVLEEIAKANYEARMAALKRVDSLTEQVVKEQESVAAIGLSKEAVAELQAAKYEDAAASKERLAVMADESDASGLLGAAYRAEAEALRRLANLKREGAAKQVAADEAKKSLEEFKALTGQMDASKLNGLFNGATDGAMKFVTALQLVASVQDKSAAAYKANAVANGKDAAKFGEVQKQIAAQSAVATLTAYGAMTGALKGYAKEGSRTYAALQNAERVFQAFQLATTLATMAEKSGLLAAFTATKLASDATLTASSMAGAAKEIAVTTAVGQAKAVAGVANQASGDPYTAFPRMAAMAAIMAGLGFVVGMGGGGGGSAAPTNTGTGTVLGDSNAKSESLSHALEQLNSTELTALSYSQQMARSLQSIERGIGGFTSLLVRGGGVKGLENSIATGYSDTALSGALKNPLISGITGLLASTIPAVGSLVTKLFGAKTSITGSGIAANAQTLGSIASGGFVGQYYADTQTKKKAFGVTYSSSSGTQTSAMDDALQRQISQIFGDVGSAVTSATQLLGRDLGQVKTQLAGYVVDLGRIDLKGLTGDQISEKLSNIFGAESDKIAQSIMPGLEGLQSVGEGYFQTLTRAASQMEVVNLMQDRLGSSLKAVGVTGAYLADSLVKTFGGLEKYQTMMSDYLNAFYTEEERNAQSTKELTKALSDMGMTLPATHAQYRQLVEAQDKTTDAGRQQHAALIALAPAFDQVTTAAQKAADAVADQRTGLQDELDELMGNSAALRARERAAIDDSNLALYDQIQLIKSTKAALDDYNASLDAARSTLASATAAVATAQQTVDGIRGQATQGYLSALEQVAQIQGQIADQARQTASTYRDLAKSLREYVAGVVVPPSDAFAKALTKALGGDQAAMASLPGLAGTATDAAREGAGSAAEFRLAQGRILAGVNAAADKAAAMGVETPAQKAATLQQKLIDAQVQLAEATRVANAINAPLAQTQATLITQYQAALTQLATAQAAAAKAQATLDAIRLNTLTSSDRIMGMWSAVVSGFAAMDASQDGLLSSAEFVKGMAGKATDGELQSLFKMLDINGDGQLTYLEAVVKNTALIAQRVGSGTASAIENATTGMTQADFAKALRAEAVKQGLAASSITSSFISGQFSQLDKNNSGLLESSESSGSAAAISSAISNLLAAQSAAASGGFSGSGAGSGGSSVTPSAAVLTAKDKEILNAAGYQAVTRPTSMPGAQIYDLYQSLLYRKPEVGGFNFWNQMYQDEIKKYGASASPQALGIIRAGIEAAAKEASITNKASSQTHIRESFIGQGGSLFGAENAVARFFATGGAFTNGIVSTPTAFNVGVMGEAGPEAIMPLTNVNGSLGIRAQMPGSEALLEEVRALRAEVINLRAETRAGVSAAQEHLQLDRRLTRNGQSMPVTSVQNDPLQVEVLA